MSKSASMYIRIDPTVKAEVEDEILAFNHRTFKMPGRPFLSHPGISAIMIFFLINIQLLYSRCL